MDFAKQPQTILSLCTGMRGLERGIERTGTNITIAAYVEIETFIVWNLVKQMEKGLLAPAPVWTNLKTFPAQEFHGKIHGIIGGYPCQPFSVAGQQKGTEDPRHLWPYIKAMVSTIRPLWCFFENVPGHINIGFREVKSDLEGIGYKVEEGFYSAQEIGATQIRKRLYVLALANPYCMGTEGVAGTLQSTSTDNEKATQRKIRKWNRPRLGNGGKNVEHNISEGLERHSRNDSSEKRWQKQERSIAKASLFPAPQGYYQHGWEEPRIKPMLELTVNGYNFREDLLRMAGNGVVEQTAELAWMSLWNKIINQKI